MSERLEYWKTAPEILRFITEINTYLKESNLCPLLRHLVLLRVSQINGCTYCIDLHSREALRDGEKKQRLNCVAEWQEACVFSDIEKAALAWAETLTDVSNQGVSNDAYEAVQDHFTKRDLVDLTFLISTMNAWNRMSISFARETGKR